jgi:GNAT superfamily N-acetyltransferase
MIAPWQRTFRAFAGPGVAQPSDSLSVSADEAAAWLVDLADRSWSVSEAAGVGRLAAFTIRHTDDGQHTALFNNERMIGFYAASYLWIAPAWRGRGLSTPLILAAAKQRGGGIMPRGVVLQGYSHSGLAAHRAAHAWAVQAALTLGLPVPAEVRSEVEHYLARRLAAAA